MPAIFDKLEAFESWFDFSALKDKNGYDQIFSKEQQGGLIASLHAILKPFLLRRVKADVEKMLPKKREYVLFAPLTPLQRELYQAILDGTSRTFLEEKVVDRLLGSGTVTPNSIRSVSVGLKRKSFDSGINTPNKSARTSRHSTPASSIRSGRRTKRKDYSELNDRKYFASLEQSPSMDSESSDEDSNSKVLATTLDFAKKQIAAKKLQNPMMQLRLACNSPYNFFNPYLHPDGTEDDPDESLVESSGKMLLLDTLLPRLFAENHKVLIFSQFKTQLDLLQSYATMRAWPVCRIDGAVPQHERAEQIRAFNDTRGNTNLFLLSTRAGGQGINLAAADTVVLFDSDWNPQQDLQAQDRAHRIGQTRNVLVYRLATRGTVEQALLEAAQGKRRLEKLVIRNGGIRASSERGRRELRDEMEELRRLLRRADGEAFDVQDGTVLSERDLAILMDRSDDAYVRAERGDDEGESFRNVGAVDGGLLESLKV
jgi:ATP-dependent DNA helicase